MASEGLITDPTLADLREEYDSGNLVLVVGPGIAEAAGLPSPRRLVALLLERAMQRRVPEASLKELAEHYEANSLLDAFDCAKTCLGEMEFGDVVERNLKDDNVPIPTIAQVIGVIASGLRAALTVNLDHILERSLGGSWPVIRGSGDVARRRRFILKMHGTLLERSTWVLTREDYDRLPTTDPVSQSAFSALFQACPLLFVGHDPLDAAFERLLDRVRNFTQGSAPRHFLLISREIMGRPERRKRLEAMGLRIVPYADHDEEIRILETLAGARSGSGQVRSRQPETDIPARLGIGDTSQAQRALVEELERLLIVREHAVSDRAEYDDLTPRIHDLSWLIADRARVGPGDRIGGAELVRRLESGNFATVWLSRNIATGETTATKIFHLEKLSQGLMLWRFRRSIRAMKLLTEHRDTPPNIVRIRDVADDTLSFTMDYLSGGDLERIAQLGWSLEKKIAVIVEICRAVAFAHRLGVIHRDIKPSNVVLDARGNPTLTDFDIADIRFVTKLSVDAGGLGTPVFAAPEQLENADRANERSDVYSLGRLLHFVLLEISPGLKVEDDPSLESLRRFPAALVAIVRRATQYRQDRRYVDVSEMIVDLERYQTRLARMRARIVNSWRWTLRNRFVLTVLTLILGGSLGFAAYQRRERAEKEQLALRVAVVATSLDGIDRKLEKAAQKRNQLSVQEEHLARLRDEIRLQLQTPGARESLLKEKLRSIEQELEEVRRDLAGIENDIATLRRDRDHQSMELAEIRRRLPMPAEPRRPPAAASSGAEPAASATVAPAVTRIQIDPDLPTPRLE